MVARADHKSSSSQLPSPPREKQASQGRAARRPADEARATQIQSSISEFDRLIHERIRLGILSALAVNSVLTFNDLKRLLQTTDGNLSVHARKLEEAQYITCSKYFDGRVPR